MDNNEHTVDYEDIDDEINAEPEERKGFGLGWRIVVGIIAIVIIGVLAYPLIRQPDSNNKVEPAVPAEVQATVSGPEATAQANPESAESQFELGNAYYQARQWDQAITAYQKVIELDPNFQAAFANLGATYYQQSRFDLAASQYEKALELDSDDGESAYNLGAIYLQQALSQTEKPDLDLLNRAIDQIQKALEISPGLAEPHFSLGVAYMASNQKPEAVQSFETFLSLDTSQNSQARQDAERYLQLLSGQ